MHDVLTQRKQLPSCPTFAEFAERPSKGICHRQCLTKFVMFPPKSPTHKTEHFFKGVWVLSPWATEKKKPISLTVYCICDI